MAREGLRVLKVGDVGHVERPQDVDGRPLAEGEHFGEEGHDAAREGRVAVAVGELPQQLVARLEEEELRSALEEVGGAAGAGVGGEVGDPFGRAGRPDGLEDRGGQGVDGVLEEDEGEFPDDGVGHSLVARRRYRGRRRRCLLPIGRIQRLGQLHRVQAQVDGRAQIRQDGGQGRRGGGVVITITPTGIQQIRRQRQQLPPHRYLQLVDAPPGRGRGLLGGGEAEGEGGLGVPVKRFRQGPDERIWVHIGRTRVRTRRDAVCWTSCWGRGGVYLLTRATLHVAAARLRFMVVMVGGVGASARGNSNRPSVISLQFVLISNLQINIICRLLASASSELRESVMSTCSTSYVKRLMILPNGVVSK